MSLDEIFIEFVHNLAEMGGSFFTPFFRFISILGEKSWLFVLIAIILMLKKKTRWVGATIFLAILLGFIFSSVLIKPIIMRDRPYVADIIFQKYWEFVGGIMDTGYSMPSGHCTGVTAFFVSLYITSKKQNRGLISTIGIICVTLMVFARCYFMHHYFTDCVAGIILGTIVSFIAKAIIRIIHMICKKYEDITLFNFILNFNVGKKA